MLRDPRGTGWHSPVPTLLPGIHGSSCCCWHSNTPHIHTGLGVAGKGMPGTAPNSCDKPRAPALKPALTPRSSG